MAKLTDRWWKNFNVKLFEGGDLTLRKFLKARIAIKMILWREVSCSLFVSFRLKQLFTYRHAETTNSFRQIDADSNKVRTLLEC